MKFQPSDQSVFCSCMKFQTFGILCCHALKVLDVLDIKKVPDQYILTRWTRQARKEVVASMNNDANVLEDKKLAIGERYRRACPLLVDIASRASGDEKAFELIMKVARELRKQVEDIFLHKPTTSPDEQNNSSEVLDERTDQETQLEDLLQKVKGLKKKKKLVAKVA